MNKKQTWEYIQEQRKRLWYSDKKTAIKEFQGKYVQPTPLPLRLNIETTNQCQGRCIMCLRNKMVATDARPLGFMDMQLWQKIIDEVTAPGNYAGTITIGGAGEPFLHPYWDRLLHYAMKKGIERIVIPTNGMDMPVSKIVQLAKKKPRSTTIEIVISLDGLGALHQAIRPGISESNVSHNTLELIAQNPNLDINISFIAMKENQHQQKEFIRYYKPYLRVRDKIQIRPFRDWSGQVYDRSLKQHKANWRRPCDYLWEEIQIWWDGTCSICCNDFLGKAYVGNLNTEKLKEIWQYKAMEYIRKAHLRMHTTILDIQHYENLCRKCTHWQNPRDDVKVIWGTK